MPRTSSAFRVLATGSVSISTNGICRGHSEIDQAPSRAITITVSVVNGLAMTEKRVYSGSYCLEGGMLYLRVVPSTAPEGGTRVNFRWNGRKTPSN